MNKLRQGCKANWTKTVISWNFSFRLISMINNVLYYVQLPQETISFAYVQGKLWENHEVRNLFNQTRCTIFKLIASKGEENRSIGSNRCFCDTFFLNYRESKC